jgi:hypothetical protein
MWTWIKRLYKSYERKTLQQYDVPPTVYKIGNKRYVKKKKISKGPVPRTRYDKSK